jgi:7-carboxy-7-deazaguanine synthase
VKTIPVVEMFGPTIQGEGALAGLSTLFLRTGLCDYRCEWCDSMHAVDPVQVKAGAERLNENEIRARLFELPWSPWLTVSGGNPAMHDLGQIVSDFHAVGRRVSVETQGSLWRDWLADVDHLTVSPKPPSSGMTSPEHDEQTAAFLTGAELALPKTHRSLKIVVFDQEDLTWARRMIRRYPEWHAFLSVGTDRPNGHEPIRMTLKGISDRYRWLCEQVVQDPYFADVRVFPQLHVIAWGHKLGV